MNAEETSAVVVDVAFHLHKDLGLKSVETLAPVHSKQLLTYLRLLNLPLGLLINFGAATFKEGIKRIVNNHQDFASSRPRVHARLGYQAGRVPEALRPRTAGPCG